MPYWDDLSSASGEINAVLNVFPNQTAMTFEENGNATTAEAILEKLPHATILHLACHGHQNPNDPLKSGFVMRDEMLTIEKLMHVPTKNAFMAFLSACETAKADKVSIHIGV